MQKQSRGFTIVELLIVIVVIAILATISIVAYNGVQARAYQSKTQSNFRNITQALTMYKTDKGYFPMCLAGDNTDCDMTEIAPQLTMSTIPTKTGSNDAITIRYVINNSSGGQWAVRFQKTDGSYCKMGQDVYAGWWGSAPACW